MITVMIMLVSDKGDGKTTKEEMMKLTPTKEDVDERDAATSAMDAMFNFMLCV